MPQEEVTLFWHLSHIKYSKLFLQKIKDLVMTENINIQTDACMTCNRHQPSPVCQGDELLSRPLMKSPKALMQ